MADGGEGTLDCVAAACRGAWRQTTIDAIHGRPVAAEWYDCGDGLAVIESARVLGLPLVQTHADAPGIHQRSSHALGVLLRTVLDAGARRILVGLGGSACNDAGLGLLTALGCVPNGRDGHSLTPDMNGLIALDTLSCASLDPRLAHTDIRVLCDVDNPLLGARGASRIYGPQKGLGDDEIEAVDAACHRLAQIWQETDLGNRPGSGAAGGLGFALAAIGGQLQPGADTLIEMTGLRARLATADRVITGEGRSDAQTLSGKLPLTIARLAPAGRTVLVSGAIDTQARQALDRYFVACHALTDYAGSSRAAQLEPARWLRHAGQHIGRDLAARDNATRGHE